MRAQFVFPTLPRNPVLRAVALIGGAIVLVGLIAMGFVVGLALVASAALVLTVRHWLGRRRANKPDPSIIEGEFTVVPQHRLDQRHAHE